MGIKTKSLPGATRFVIYRFDCIIYLAMNDDEIKSFFSFPNYRVFTAFAPAFFFLLKMAKSVCWWNEKVYNLAYQSPKKLKLRKFRQFQRVRFNKHTKTIDQSIFFPIYLKFVEGVSGVSTNNWRNIFRYYYRNINMVFGKVITQ